MSITIELQSDLFNDHVTAREDGLGAVINPDISYESWSKSVQACGSAWRTLEKQQDGIEFILGDLYLAGEKYFPTQFENMMDNAVIDYKKLTRILWVCKNIPAEQRHLGLSVSHHEVVAKVPILQREELLEEAETENLTVADLTKLRKAKCPTDKDKKPAKKASKSSQDAPQAPIQDEQALLVYGHNIIAYLEAEEKVLPFRDWPANRLKAWAPILSTITKIARRSIIKTH